MKDVLIAILETFCPNAVFLQGSLNPNEAYPQKFITFFTRNSEFDRFFDNDPNVIFWDISVIFYSNDPREVNTIPRQILTDLKNAGFIPQNAGIDVISDVETHTGWAMDVIYPEKLSKGE